MQKNKYVNAWLKNNSLNASTETLSWVSDTSSTNSGSSTIYESDIFMDDEEQFEEKCIRQISQFTRKEEEGQIKESKKQNLQQDIEFENLFEKMKIKFPFIQYPNYSSSHVSEGTEFVKNMFGIGNLNKENQVHCGEEMEHGKLPEFTFLSSYKKALSINIRSRLTLLRTDYTSLEDDQAVNEKSFHQLESSLKLVCYVREHDKLLLHVSEVKNLCFLLVGLSCRLVRIEHALAGMNWGKVEERGDLERKRKELDKQMDEGKMLKEKIDRRSKRVGDYFELYFSEKERDKFVKYMRCRIKICIQMREVTEKIRISENLSEFVNKIR